MPEFSQEFFTVLSLILWIFCLVVILKQPKGEVSFAGYTMGPILRVLFMLVLISVVGLAFMWLYWIGKFLLLPLQLLLDVIFGTSYW